MPRTTGSHDQAELIELAIAGIDAQIRELQQKKASLQARTKGGSAGAAKKAATASPVATPAKRVFSAATKKRLSIAAKRRWARERAARKKAA